MSFVVILYYLPSDNNGILLIVSKKRTDCKRESIEVKNNRMILQYLVIGKVLRWLSEDPPIGSFFSFFFLFFFFIS